MVQLKVNKLDVDIKIEEKYFRVLNNISFELEKAAVLGIVGESGCGKTMLAYCLEGLLPDVAKIDAGTCYFNDKEIDLRDKETMRLLRKHDYSMIFQNPLSALNPLITVGKQVAEALPSGTKDVKKRVCQMFAEVKLKNPEVIYDSYPHQLSGGMCQRVMIAMALIASPKFLIADEPTTALDVTTEAEIIALMKELLASYGTTMIFISHDLAIIRKIADRVAIMYAGEIVESGETEEIFSTPFHPYTKGLLASRPLPEDKGKLLKTIAGSVPALEVRDYNLCTYYNRCRYKIDQCKNEKPDCQNKGNRYYKCHLETMS